MRRRLVLISVAVVALAVVPLTAVFALTLSRVLERDSYALLQARIDSVASTLEVHQDRVRARETGGDAILDPTTWIFDTPDRPLEQPAQRSPADAVARALAADATRTRAPVHRKAGELSLLAAPVTVGGGRSVTVVAGLSTRPYEDAERAALTAAIVLDAAILLIMGLLTWQTVTQALAPVARMTATAADWGAHDTARRFDLGPPRDELTALAATLDELLGRLQASLGHERRLTGEIAHELRTPITRIRTKAEVALRSRASIRALREALADVVDDTELLARAIDSLLQTAATRDPGAPVGTAVGEVIDRALAESGLEHATVEDLAGSPVDGWGSSSAAGHPLLAADPYTAVRALIPVLGNARDYGGGHIHLSVRCTRDQVTIAVQDDGPGFADDDLERLFQPGVRGAASGLVQGAGLGLPLARRLARSCGGDVTIGAGPGPGALVLVTFPSIPAAAETHSAQSPPPSMTSTPCTASLGPVASEASVASAAAEPSSASVSGRLSNR